MGEAQPDDVVYVVGHRHPDTDSVCSAIAYAHLKNALGDARVRPAIAGDLNGETLYVLRRFGLSAPIRLTRATGCRLILVDHNEVAQALEDIAHATILEVWEHHRIGDLHLHSPIVFHCEPVGATATLIADQFRVSDVVPPPPIAGAMLAAILSDTLALASPTVSDKDRQAVRRLEALADVDASTLAREMLEARGDLSGRPAAELVEGDFKEFEMAGHRVGIGQVEGLDVTPLLARRDSLVEEMQRLRREKGLLQVLLLLTDIGRRGSHLLVAGGPGEVVERALGCRLADGAAWIDGCMSRKKQVVPPLEEEFARVGLGSSASPQARR